MNIEKNYVISDKQIQKILSFIVLATIWIIVAFIFILDK